MHHEICDSSYTPVKFCSLFFEKMPVGSGEQDCRRLEWAVGAGNQEIGIWPIFGRIPILMSILADCRYMCSLKLLSLSNYGKRIC